MARSCLPGSTLAAAVPTALIAALAATLACLAGAPAARAGGTLAFTELLPLLRGKPQLSGVLFQAYRLPASAFAAVRLGPHFTHLGGRRLGPYLFEAQPLNPATGGAVLISLCTQPQFLDRAGRPLPAGEDPPIEARDVREDLTAIVIREPSAISAGPGCP
ncbi:hypothetical protein [Cyanobium sp. CH-040]|uniref:hypothetical protein n=1 Tax=Cyanobium sp. CH-040 TaxID=2823708 RepID=UPI0020CCD083|nr:hypothetical protein [Cyanobium sp. CH-040]MCP9927774.1 hypothetical protein [Cyanobium sp. CH-040]